MNWTLARRCQIFAVLVLGSSLILTSAARPVAAAPAATTAPAVLTDLDELLKLFAARHSARATFTEVHEMAILDRPLESSGELLYETPDRLEKRTFKPKTEDLVLEGGVLTAERGHHHYSITLRDHPEAVPYIEPIRATLAGDRAALERYFAIEFTGSMEDWTLTLVPADRALARTVKRVRLQGAREHITSVEVLETNGDRSLTTISAEVTP